ncbi:hypothetical protein [Streptomyces lunalinharesii]
MPTVSARQPRGRRAVRAALRELDEPPGGRVVNLDAIEASRSTSEQENPA